jgi:cyclic beta-1,2-glucan synthetase
MKGLPVDLVIINEEAGGYEQTIQDLVRQLITSGHAQAKENRPGGVFLKKASHLSSTELRLLEATARVTVGTGIGSLGEKARSRPNRLVAVSRRGLLARRRPPEQPVASVDNDTIDSTEESALQAQVPAEVDGALDGISLDEVMSTLLPMTAEILEGKQGQLAFFNGYGGFSPDGREYVILLREGISTPAPWINVISNPNVGFLISESGAGYTWTENSRENKLTPWSNDPVIDPPGEVIYLQDLDLGDIWSPTAAAIREPEPYIVSHGHGYSRFFHDTHGIEQVLWTFVPLKDPVKIYRLKLRNRSMDSRRLAVSFYVELTLGVHREMTEQHIVTSLDEKSQAVLARNVFRDEIYAHRMAFASTSLKGFSFTGQRHEFIGRHGTLASPAGLSAPDLSGKVGPGLDPCMVIKGSLELQPGEEREVIFLLGETDSLGEVRRLVEEYTEPTQVQGSLTEIQAWWDETLNSVQVETPNQGLDILVNRWLLYQNLSCRMWGRSAFYQAGGAYGFRDQLQDSMALLLSRPELTRAHILRAAAQQYVEGDVQHWWHPDSNRGIRTRFADDLLWLPLVTAKYVSVTGDTSIWEEEVGFLEDEPLRPEEQERFGVPRRSAQKASILQHCWRAIDHSLRFG